MMRRRSTGYVILGAVLLLIPQGAVAQSGAAIAGRVTDASGGVIPGVTVEVSSPALIEKARTAITDGAGLYQIVELRPGVYSLTFTLPGFSLVRREGVELTTGVTVTVNASMRIGEVEETVTVTGASPAVDVRNVAQQRAVTRDVLDAIPTGGHISTFVALIPGMQVTGGATFSQDVGGLAGANQAVTVIHGGRTNDGMNQIDGMSVNSLARTGSTRMMIQPGNLEEVVVQYAAHSAELETGGVRINVIPKEGANKFSGSFYGSFMTDKMQSNNFTEELKNRGLNTPNRLKRLLDVNPSLGGPLKQDQLWFYTSYRRFITEQWVADRYVNLTPMSWFYTPDFSRQAFDDQRTWDQTLRLTWQGSPRNKFNGYLDYNYTCLCHSGSVSSSPEATSRRELPTPVYQVTWSSPVTSRLLLEAGLSINPQGSDSQPQPEMVAAEGPITVQSSGLRYRGGGHTESPNLNSNFRTSMSYVTGTHFLKVGAMGMYATATTINHGSVTNTSYRLSAPLDLGGVPNQVTYSAAPFEFSVYVRPWALYAQDQWTTKRLTLNGGLRFDALTTSYPDIRVPPVQWLPVARNFPGSGVLNYRDLSPRLGASYDVFGTGKTAVKVSLNRYVIQEEALSTRLVHPLNSVSTNVSRSWTDLNRDFIVQGDPLNPGGNLELGPSPNAQWGLESVTVKYDPDQHGFGRRPFQWETSIGIQQELRQNVSVNLAYFRRSFGNFQVTDNLAVNRDDYDSFCITAPVDSRLPGGGGNRICDLFDVTPTKFGAQDNSVTRANRFGQQSETRGDVDLTVNVRFPKGTLLQGGVSTGKFTTDNCDVAAKVDQNLSLVGYGNTTKYFPPDTEPSRRFCHIETPFVTQVKILGAYTLPWAVQASGTFQSIPGDMVWASYVARNAAVRPELGRDLAAGVNGTKTVNLVEPGTMYLERTNQVDFRVARTFVLGRTRFQAQFNVYNALNANPVQVANYTYTSAATWLTPQVILPGRVVKVGAQVLF